MPPLVQAPIARLPHDWPTCILVLDEATSNVDTRTELQNQEALLRLMAGRTAIVIAHRLSTIRQADQVLVINHGRIIERGTHDTLLAQRGFYHDLYMASSSTKPTPVRYTCEVRCTSLPHQ